MKLDSIKDAATSDLVAFWNLHNEKKIKKFETRAIAIERCTNLAKSVAGFEAPPKFDIHAPAPPVVEDPVEEKPAAPVKRTAAAKQNTPPHLNLRCPSCGYYAKTTPACLKQARLICPVDPKHGKLLTAEERNEKRGR